MEQARMQSSRMRTARSLPLGGGLCPGGLCQREGVSVRERGVSVWLGESLSGRPPVDRQTPV